MCLYSTIGVYHVTSPVTSTNGKHGQQSVPWSIAVRCSKEQTPVTDQSDNIDAATDVLTPPLVIPLQSGDCYFMLDDFNHHHEHLVLAGEVCIYAYVCPHLSAACICDVRAKMT